MTLDFLEALHHQGGANVSSDNKADNALRQIENKLIELATKWFAALASPFTTAGAGAWEDVTGMTASVTPTYDAYVIHAGAKLQFESPGTAAAVITARMIIGADTGEEFIVEVPNTITDKMNMSVSHAFQGIKGTAYTVKLQVKDDATTAMTVGIATMKVDLARVSS